MVREYVCLVYDVFLVYLGERAKLSRKVALAIDEEQSRCGYLADQMTTMLNEHDKNESLPNGLPFYAFSWAAKKYCLAERLYAVFLTFMKTINPPSRVSFCLLLL